MAIVDAPEADAEDMTDEAGKPDRGDGSASKLTEAKMKTMRERYTRAVEREKKNREDAREDLQFTVGEQWPSAEKKARGDRPAMVFDRTRGFIRQVTGDVRQNKPAIRVRPNGDGADKDTAEMFAGLIRNIEQQSYASHIYSQAANNSTSCGFGYFRIVTQYAGDDSFEQDIRIKGIPNALSVVRDYSEELDRSDANWWFIYSSIPIEDFKAQYPKARHESFEKNDVGYDDSYTDWYTKDTVRIAEYWCKEPCKKTVAQLSDGRVICLDDYEDDKLAEMMGDATVVQKRTIKSHKVVQHIVSGAEELEDPTEWATDDIPIIEVSGEETWIDERRVVQGLIRPIKDAQRSYNYERSTMIEVTALQPKAPYKLSANMIAGHEAMWQNAGNTNYPYLIYNSDPNMPNRAPEREQPPIPATGLMAGAQMSIDDMKAGTGIYDASLGAHSNETSGKAIDARKMEGDVSTFVYIDNLALGIGICGRQLVKLIPKIYDTKRVARVLYDDGSDDQVKLNHPVLDQSGKQKVVHQPAKGFYDLTIGKYDVTVDAGPGFSTRRAEAAQGIRDTMQAVGPVGAVLLSARMAELQDWPKHQEIADDLKKLLPPELQEPKTGPDGQPLPPEPPPPNPAAIAAQQEMEAAKQKAMFDEASMRAQIELQKEKQDALNQLAAQAAQQKADLARWESEQTAQLNAWIAEQDAQLELAKAQHQSKLTEASHAHKADLERSAMQAKRETDAQANAPSELGELSKGLTQALTTFIKVVAAPSEVINDAQGNVIGVRKLISPQALEMGGEGGEQS